MMTADELLVMPDARTQLYELVQGELITMPFRGAHDGMVSSRIASHLGNHVHEHKLGRTVAANTGYILARNPDTVRAPSASFVSNARFQRTEGYFPGAPDLAIEVIRGTDLYSDVEAKPASTSAPAHAW